MKVRLGSTKYDVLRPEHVIAGDGVFLGLCDRDGCELLIQRGLKLQAAKQTFWHEVVHALLFEIAEDELGHDEQFVEAFSRLLYAFHEDNSLTKIYETLHN
jgi:hypothetical protein